MRPMCHIAHRRNICWKLWLYHNVDLERRKPINQMVLICKSLNLFHPRILYAKFGWNLPSGSGKDFQILSMYFHYFVIFSPWKRTWPFIWTNLNPLLQRNALCQFWLKLAQCFWRTFIKKNYKKIYKLRQCITVWGHVYRQTDVQTIDGQQRSTVKAANGNIKAFLSFQNTQ